MKKRKKKIALPRRRWQINRSTRVKALAKVYSPRELEAEITQVAE